MLLQTIQPENFKDPLLNSLVFEMLNQVKNSAQLISTSTKSQEEIEGEYDEIQNTYFTALARFILKLSQKESQIVKDYTCKMVKNASLNCPDDFFTSFIVGLDPAQNGEFISRDQDDEDSDTKDESEHSSDAGNEHENSKDVTETDQFVFT